MTKLVWCLWVALGVTVQGLISDSHAMEVVHFRSAATAPAAKTGGHAGELAVWGHIGFPEGDGPFPAVVLLHGCAGLQPNNFRWARFLNRHGYLTLILDSFGPRSHARNCSRDFDQSTLSDRQLDTIGAHTYLVSRPDVDPERIALMGWSQGATVALELVGQKPDRSLQGFEAVVAFYPYCMPEMAITKPALIMIGDADDWSPANRCRELTDRSEPGGLINLVVYHRAFHAFDIIELFDGTVIQGPGGEHWIKYDPRAYQDSMFQVQSFLLQNLAAP